MEEEKRVRLYVGGLGAAVEAEDLKRAFGSLGTVLSVEMISKEPHFAYIDFEAASPAALRKVFSTTTQTAFDTYERRMLAEQYKGCKWKGGCLRVEKAKEDYMTRLKREWADASAKLPTANLELKSADKPPKFNPSQELKLFFPKLRKVKTVSARGTRGHKRSFERCNAHPLSLLALCSCDGHENEEADPFEYEHDAYLRIVDKFDSNNQVQSVHGQLSPVNSEDFQRKHATEGTARGLKRKIDDDKQPVEDANVNNNCQSLLSAREDENVKNQNASEDVKGRRKDKQNKRRKILEDYTIPNISEETEAPVEDAELSDEVVDEDGVILPGIIKRRNKVQVKASNKWDRVFEAAAGAADREADFHMDDFEGKGENDKWDNLFEAATGYIDKKGEEDDVDHDTDKPPQVDKKKVRKVKFADKPVDLELPKNDVELLEDDVKLPDNPSKDVKLAKDDVKLAEDSMKLVGDNVKPPKNTDVKPQTEWIQFSSWKALVGEGGNASFSLSGVVGSETQKQTDIGITSTTTLDKHERPVDKGPEENDVAKLEKKSLLKNVKHEQRTVQVPSVKELLKKESCGFMRSSNAEEEWLNSKGKLSSDYKGKHKAALRSNRKLHAF